MSEQQVSSIRQAPKIPRGKLLKRLWQYLGRYRLLLVLAMILVILTNALSLAGPKLSGLAIDAAVADPNEDSVAKAQIAVAEAKILTTEIAIEATNRLFELAGTRSTLAAHNLDRHWRNARTHTLHDPVRWKYAILGNYYLNGINPPLHAWS